MSTKKVRKTHTAEFKAEALKLTDKIGVAATARELKLHEFQLYNWRTAAEKKSTTSGRESERIRTPRKIIRIAPVIYRSNINFYLLQTKLNVNHNPKLNFSSSIVLR